MLVFPTLHVEEIAKTKHKSMSQSIRLKEAIQKIENRLILSFKDDHQNENTKLKVRKRIWWNPEIHAQTLARETVYCLNLFYS